MDLYCRTMLYIQRSCAYLHITTRERELAEPARIMMQQIPPCYFQSCFCGSFPWPWSIIFLKERSHLLPTNMIIRANFLFTPFYASCDHYDAIGLCSFTVRENHFTKLMNEKSLNLKAYPVIFAKMTICQKIVKKREIESKSYFRGNSKLL